MQAYRCKCGKSEMLCSGEVPKPCQGCPDCNTTYAQHPDDHKEPVPHTWKPQFDRNTGEPDRPHCMTCFERGPKPEAVTR